MLLEYGLIPLPLTEYVYVPAAMFIVAIPSEFVLAVWPPKLTVAPETGLLLEFTTSIATE